MSSSVLFVANQTCTEKTVNCKDIMLLMVGQFKYFTFDSDVHFSFIFFFFFFFCSYFCDFSQKIKIVCLRKGFVSGLTQICWIQLWCLFVLFWTKNILFWHKIKIARFRWNLVSRLIQIYWVRWWCSFVLFWTEN